MKCKTESCIALGNNTQGKFKAKYILYINATLFSVFHVNELIVPLLYVLIMLIVAYHLAIT